MPVECILKCRNELGESPLWHHQERALYWVDAIKPAIHRYDPKTKAHQSWSMPELTSSIAMCKKGGLIASMGTGFVHFDTQSGSIEPLTQVLSGKDAERINDGKCDPLGRFWAGTVSPDPHQGLGKLFCLSRSYSVTTMKENVILSNGLAWSPCHSYFYFTDTLRSCIYRYRWHKDSGTISDQEIFITLDNKIGNLDGLTVDQQGYLWSAIWDGYKIIRFTPTGEIDSEITMPVQRPTSCIFGGDDMQTLFITSASRDVNEPEPLADEFAGGVFAIHLDVAGLPEPQYLG